MELVKEINDIIVNAKKADIYLNSGSTEEREFILEKIHDGRCFVVIKCGEQYQFYPSKYIGYKDNTPDAYYKAYYNASALPGEEDVSGGAGMYDFDGRMSNRAINKILNCKCTKDYEMLERFVEFCESLGLKGSYKRKFWLNVIEIE